MEFTSKNPGYQLIVREPEVERYGDGRERQIRPLLYADFSEQALGVETYEGFEGEQPYTQTRGGGFFDTEKAQRDKGWTDEERKAVEQRLLQLSRNNPNPGQFDKNEDGYGDVELHVPPKAEPPWPTYDEAPTQQVAKLAAELGLAAEALHYEQRTKQRKSVLEPLEELLELQRAEDELTAA